MRTIWLKGKQFLVAHQLLDVLAYLIFGVLTTLVNIGVFALATRLSLSWQGANFWAWLLSVLFAFVTNKRWVFKSQTTSWGSFLWEFSKFIGARVLSLGIDYACMFLFIQALSWHDLAAKIVTQVVIVVANYLLSKFLIFTAHA
ncbi:GtrA family protein [Lacticaseibacillus baoqingensis]|uniref:GtrA family protein n=1 Tax=Lacticaseibacillus baoqingensis TaxID=2486013 RepID=A0ABW4E7Y3_9LACO|nr:GtrA family protein [Lacticaseibacillus baoqingensis]